VTEFVTETLPRLISELSALAYLLVFLGGVLTSIGPCNLAMVPVVMGYVGGQHGLTRARGFWLSSFFTLGSSATFMLLGVVAAPEPKRVAMTGLIGALVLGLIVGLAGSQCATPVLVAILGIVMAKGKLAYGASLLFAYGLGRGVPIILAGTFTGMLKALPAMDRWSRWMERAAGVVLIAVGVYFIWIA
jgi:cytochrome c-type biogenesis protein